MAKYPYYIPANNVYKPWIKICLGYKRTHKITPIPIIALINKKPTFTFTTANNTTFSTVKDDVMLYGLRKQKEIELI